MTEQIFESKFHRDYVRGEGPIAEKPFFKLAQAEVGMDYEETLRFYRNYVGDQEAELPEEILEQLEISRKI